MKKDTNILIRLSEKDKRLITEKAEKLELNVSQYVRLIALKGYLPDLNEED